MLQTEIDEQSKNKIHLTRLTKRTAKNSLYRIEKKSHFIKTLYIIKGIKITKTQIDKNVHGSGYTVLYVMKRYWIIRILREKHLRKTSMFIPPKIHYHTVSK